MAKSIPLTQGKFAIVDDGDFEYLNQFSWSLNGAGYARRVTKRPEMKTILMHREIMGVTDGSQIDHIDMDILNNQKSNLRICNKSQNAANVNKQKRNTSGYKGVFKNHYGWFARISVNNKKIYLGNYQKNEDAAAAYNAAAVKYFGEFARPNE